MCDITVNPPETNKIEPTILSPTGQDLSVLDYDAVRAVTRLIDKGFEAYLVGGCVRDLLLQRTPKDYDIATAARPPQVKRTFPRNCRIIGRRFKLAHLHFHGNTKILECSTFRRTPEERDGGEPGSPGGSSGQGGGSDDLLITRDNEFGTAEEDALRRDFTINALFLDPTKNKIVDHVDGLADIEDRVIRTIGDPVVRFREDPVRILRAVKFAGRLGFEIEQETLSAMAETADDLVRAAPPRVLEEILRLLRSGHALPSFQLLRDIDAIQHLIPVVGRFLETADDDQRSSFWALLEALDDHVQAQPDGSQPPPNGVLLATLMYGAVSAEVANQPKRSASSIAEELLGSLATDLRLPRRDSGCLKRACGVQHRFSQPEKKRRFRVDSFLRSPYFEEALHLFALRTAAENGDLETLEHWQDLAEASRPADSGSESDDGRGDEHEHRDEPRGKRKRRRRRRGGDSDGDGDRDGRDGRDRERSGRDRQDRDRADGDVRSDHRSEDGRSRTDDGRSDGGRSDGERSEHERSDEGREERPRRGRSKLRAPKKRPFSPQSAIDEDVVFQQGAAADDTDPKGSDPKGSDLGDSAENDRPQRGRSAKRERDESTEDEARKDETTENASSRDAASPQTKRPRRRVRPTRRPAAAEASDVLFPTFESESSDDFASADREREPLAGRDEDRTEDHGADAPRAESRDASSADSDETQAQRKRRSRRRGRRGTGGREEPSDSFELGDAHEERPGHGADARSQRDDLSDEHASEDKRDGDDQERDDRERDDRERGDREPGEEAGERRRRRRGRGRGRARADDRDEERSSRGDDRERAPADAADADRSDRDSSSPRDDEPAQGERRSRSRGGRGRSRRDRDDKPDRTGGRTDRKREDGRKRGDRRDDGKRGRGGGGRKKQSSGGQRDVDVVPRYRDRRGKVEVIEPVNLDLSAFDVELDPKRVPTFGSIVEGKSRPKRRGPRMADREGDDYRPPPPPGGGGGDTPGKDGTPPPPPPSSGDDDTFGDW
ncbi:MAG: polynucleotide adenylyltransferase PcnB [Planctomycetota bacterium]